MKAIFFEKHGGPEVLRYGDVPDPTPKAGEALVRVRAVALNHLDIWVRMGWKGLHLDMPHITGSDVAGEIVEVNGASNWTKGLPVIICPGISTLDDEWTRKGEDSVSPGYKIIGEHIRGGMAEYITVPIQNLFTMPAGLDFAHAAAPLLVATTCWRMLFRRAKIMAGETVLVVGAGGGVNSLAIQMCKAAGLTVYATTSTEEKAKLAGDLGAAAVVNHTKDTQWHAEILRLTKGRGVDIVVDNVGQATFSKSLRTVARGGRIVTVGNTSGHEIIFDNRLIFAKQVSIIGSTMGSRQDFIDAMAFIMSHSIKVAIDRIANLKDGIKMLGLLEEGKQFGKIVLGV